MKKIIIFFILWMINTSLNSQWDSCKFQFTVIDKNSGIPVSGLPVILTDNNISGFTDFNGGALFENYCANSAKIITWFSTDTSLSINVINRDTIFIDLGLFEDIHGVHIHAKTELIHHNHLHLKNLSLLESSNISEKMKGLSMVQLISTGRTISKPIIQNLFGSRVPILQDNLAIGSQPWGNDHAPELGRSGIQDIEIQKGANAILKAFGSWGNNINVKYVPNYDENLNQFKWNTSFESNGNVRHTGLHFSKSNNKNKSGFYTSTSFTDASDYSVPQGIVANTAMNEQFFIIGGKFKLINTPFEFQQSYFRSKSGIYLGSHIGNTTDLLNSINNQNNIITYPESSYNIGKPYQSAIHYLTQIQIPSKQRNYPKLQLSYQRNERKEYDPHRNSSLQFPQLNLWLNQIAQKSYFSLWNQIYIGEEVEISNQDYGGYYLVPMMQQLKAALLGAWKIPIRNKNLENTLSTRLNYVSIKSLTHNNTHNYSGFSIGNSTHFHSKKNHHELHTTIAWRPPSINELYSKGVHHGSASYEEGNSNLKAETGIKAEYVLNGRNKLSNWIVQGFYQYSPNYIHLNPQVKPILTVRGAFPHYIYEQLPSSFLGIAVDGNLKLRHFNFRLYAEITYGQIHKPERYPTFLPPPRILFTPTYTFRENSFEINFEHIGQQSFYTIGTDLMPPPKAYTLLHFKWKLPIILLRWKLSIFIQNLTNQTYRNYLDQFRYFTPGPSRNIGINIEYNLNK